MGPTTDQSPDERDRKEEMAPTEKQPKTGITKDEAADLRSLMSRVAEAQVTLYRADLEHKEAIRQLENFLSNLQYKKEKP